MSAFRPTAPLLRRTTRTLPGEQRLNKKVRPETKPNLKDSRYLAPRLPKNKAGLRIRLISPAKGFNVKTVGYRIVVNDGYASPRRKPIEQIGNYDPRQRAYKTPGKSLLNDGETVYQKRLEWNVERLSYWIAQGAQPSPRLVWLMQQAGVSLDPQVHKQKLEALESSRRLSRFGEYAPDISMPNDPKQRTRLEMRAKVRYNRAVSLEPGSEAWLEAQMLMPENEARREFAAAQHEPYPLVPPGLEKHKQLPITSRYAREYPIWIARGVERIIDDRAAALGRPDITKDHRDAEDEAYKSSRPAERTTRVDPFRLSDATPPHSALTERLARERATRRRGDEGPRTLHTDA